MCDYSLEANSVAIDNLEPKYKCILAGNSRLELDSKNFIRVEPQIQAFEAGLSFATRIYREIGLMPPISIAFDHKGVFRKQFLKDGLSNSQKRNPRLSQLKDDVIKPFEAIAYKMGIPLEHIAVIHEDSAKTHIAHLLTNTPIPRQITNRMIASPARNNLSEDTPCSPGQNTSSQITCAAITSEYFQKAAETVKNSAEANILLEVFFEDAPWSRVLTYMRGLQLTHSLGFQFALRLNLVTSNGSVYPGDLVSCNRENV